MVEIIKKQHCTRFYFRSSEGSSGVGYEKGVLLPSILESIGERCELPSGIRCRATAANWIMAYFEGHTYMLML